MMMLLSNNSLLSPFRNENDTGIIWIDQFKNYEGLESTFEKLTIESKILLVYMAIVCVLFLSALITIVCCRSPIFKDENTTLKPNTTYSYGVSGKLSNNSKYSSLKYFVKKSVNTERLI